MPDGSLRCDSCNKEILLEVTMAEGVIKFYCHRCRHYHEIRASTAQVGREGLTREIKSVSLSSNSLKS